MTCYSLACRQKEPCKTLAECEKRWHACSINKQTAVIPPDADIVHHIYHWRCGECTASWTLHSDGNWYRDPL